MSTVALSKDGTRSGPTGIDLTRPRVPMHRLVAVELRKLVDTRAGFWLAAAIVIVSLAITGGLIAFADESALTFESMFGLMNLPTGFLLPVLAILLVTSEWSQRTGLVTFSLEPRRSRIVTAKLATALVAAVGAVGVSLAFGALGTVLAGALRGGEAGTWNVEMPSLVGAVLTQLFALLMGFAFAMLVMNTPAAIVMFFVLPTAWSIVGEVVPWLRDNVQEWADFNLAQLPLMDGGWPTGDEWTRLAVSGSLWVLLPLVAGVWRLLRSEVK